MVIALAEITLSAVVDVNACFRYYLLQSATLDRPSVPTTYPPEGVWDDTEPTYNPGSTESLYVVDLTVYSDGSFQYSPVSLSTAYEAAKKAYNKALAADQKVDDTAQVIMTDVTDMIVERQAIIMAAMSSYMQTSNFETFKEELAAQLKVMSDQVAITISRETESLRQANADLQAKYEKIIINYRFTEDGLQIGSNENVLTICVANDRVSFQDNGAEVAYITGRQLYITDAHILHSLRVGGIAFVPRRNGNTSIVKAV